MSDVSPILSLPLILPAQAQKHVTHNEALRLLDILVQAVVATRGQNTPPATPAEGERHIVGIAPTGLWAGRPGQIAVWEVAGGWAFLEPQGGWSAHVLAEDAEVQFIDGMWTGFGDRALRVARLGISADADTTNRLTVSSPATLLNHTGTGGHQLKVNKATTGDTASLLFQTGFSGRAEMGTAGNDDFTVKVSANGSLFRDGLRVAAATGAAEVPNGLRLPDGSLVEPALRFSGDTDTGLHRLGADQIAIVAGGAARLTVNNASVAASVPVLAAPGSLAAPGFAFGSDTDTGLTNPTADQIAVVAGGAARLTVGTTSIAASVPVLATTGSLAAPGLAFGSDTDTGITSTSADQISLVTGGTERLALGNAALTALVPILSPAGTAAFPGHAFATDPDTGLFNPAADQIALSAGGVVRATVTTTGLAVTGAVTGTAVTQTADDITAGRLLKTGDFGLGATGTIAPTVADCDLALAGGDYRISLNTVLNGPITIGSLTLATLSVYTANNVANSNNIVQIVARVNATDQWIRTRNGATWTAWRRIFNAANVIGTVGQTSGVPTGALVERGSNANGEYMRLADGTQICTHSLTMSSTAAVTWTFSAAFVVPPLVVGSGVATALSAICLDAAATATSVSLSARNNTARLASPAVFTATGRWF